MAALTGLYDLFTLPMTREPKNTGLWHMTLNLTITALYIINVVAIRVPVLTSAVSTATVVGNTIAWAFVLNLIAVVLLVISGWLGGQLVYRFGIAVPKETIEQAPRYEARPMRREVAGALGGETPPEEQEERR